MPHRGSAIILITAIVMGSSAAAATLTRLSTGRGAEIVLKGDIAREDAEALENLMRAINEEGQPVRALRLDSPGGNLLGAIALARFIRRHAEISTSVGSGSTCASACFLAFSAGSRKFADYNSFVGVHGVADGHGGVSEETEAATRMMARIGNEFGVPAEITGKIIATPPDEIAWLTPDDLRQMGATMIGRPASTPRRADAGSGVADLARVSAPLYLAQSAAEAADSGDYDTAIRLWRQLAARGHGASEYNLGEMYYAGRGVAQDYGEAAKWYERAAEQGVPAAQLEMGVACALGRGVPRDLRKAYMWLSIAALTYATEEERARAAKARDLVSRHMTASEIAAAQRLTDERARER